MKESPKFDAKEHWERIQRLKECVWALDHNRNVDYTKHEPCPRCKHARIMHIAGQCGWTDGPMGIMTMHMCGMSWLGKGNAWGLPEGWHTSEEQAKAASKMKKPPFLVPFSG